MSDDLAPDDGAYIDPVMGPVRLLARPARTRRTQAGPEFFMLRREGVLALSIALGWHGPAIMVAIEATRLAAMGRKDGVAMTGAWAARWGLTRKQVRTARLALVGAPDWVEVQTQGNRAATVTATKGAMAALIYRR